MPDTIHEQLTSYLTDAHSIEEQAIAQLRKAPDIAGDEVLAAFYREHLAESERQEATVRARLEAHGAAPSKLKDVVMKVGGIGFVLFAKSQPDTAGKLAAHSYSYEALELASYELLERVAERAGDSETAEAARAIRDEEAAMRERIAEGFERTVDASLRDLGAEELSRQVPKYLGDAHALETQAVKLLEKAAKTGGEPELERLYSQHLDESRDHGEAIEARLRALGGSPSTVKDAALGMGGLNWVAFFKAQPDTPGKLAAFVFAFEHLEIGGYEQLSRVAERAGDADTAALAERILAEERDAAERIAGLFDRAVDASLAAQGLTA